MTSFRPLSPDLLLTLQAFGEPFASSAVRFSRGVARTDDFFARMCEVVTTLELLSTALDPLATLAVLTTSAAMPDGEDLLAVMLNAEFVLYDFYAGTELALQPPLAHWVGFVRAFDRYARRLDARAVEWGLRERVLRIRAGFVKGLLCKQGPRLARVSPQEFAAHGPVFDVDTRIFRQALARQGNYHVFYGEDDGDDGDGDDGGDGDGGGCTDDDAERASEHASNGGRSMSGYSSASGFGSGHPSPDATPTGAAPTAELQASISKIITQALHDELPAATTAAVLAHLQRAPELLAAYALDPATLAALDARNATLAHGLVTLQLVHGGAATRRELLHALAFLPVDIGSLDLVNQLVLGPFVTRDEGGRLVHGVVANGIRAAEMLGGEARSRVARLLVLLVRSLLGSDAVDLQTLLLPISDLGHSFMGVPEARELWKTYCT